MEDLGGGIQLGKGTVKQSADLDLTDAVMPCTEFNVKLLGAGDGTVYQGAKNRHMNINERSSLRIDVDRQHEEQLGDYGVAGQAPARRISQTEV